MLQIMLTYIMFMNSLMFYYSKTPITMGFTLLIQTLLTSLLSGMISMSFWYMYIMFLIMMGGMLILFIYMSSLSSNQKFYFYKNNILLFVLVTTMIIIILLSFKNFYIYSTFNYDSLNLINMPLEENYQLKMSMNKLYNLPTNFIMLFMMNYLLLTLFIIVEITNIKMGPLRKNI